MLDLQPVVDLALAGRRKGEIAAALGVSVFTVSRRIGLARSRGILPADFVIASNLKRKPRGGHLPSVDVLRSNGHYESGGGIHQLLKSLPLPVAHWLIDAIPPGATVCDMLRAFITDAYNEENP